MIRQLDHKEFPLAADVIRASFLTVANDLGLTEENCPKYVGFVTTAELLHTQFDWGWWIYGLFEDEQLVGYVSISKVSADVDTDAFDRTYEIHKYREKCQNKNNPLNNRYAKIKKGGTAISLPS